MIKPALIVAAAVAVLACAAGYWYWSPNMAISNARAAATSADNDKLAQYIDLDRVRSSMRASLQAKVAAAMPQRSGVGASLGTLVGGAMLEQSLQSGLTPEALRATIAAGRPVSTTSTGGPARWNLERPTSDMVIGCPDFQDGLAPQQRDCFVWERSGFATWKLTELRLSALR